MSFSRRYFLMTSLGVISTVFPLYACTQGAPNETKTSYFSSPEHNILVKFIELLFPIHGLDKAVLSNITEGLLESAENNAGLRESLKSCISALQEKSGNGWLKHEPSKQVAIMTELEGETWFTGILLQAKAALFTHPKFWKLIGYGGSSLETGGYKYNGFDDIDWLPVTTQAEPQP